MILTKELTFTKEQLMAASTCTEAGDGYIYMQGTEDMSAPQCMGALYILNGCYELLSKAGFNVVKDETDQSLTIWGLKLKFANVGTWDYVNINAPDIKYDFNISMLTNHFTYPKTNYFLQHSMATTEGFASSSSTGYSKVLCYPESIGLGEAGSASALFFNADYQYTNSELEYFTILLTLYCSSDGIQICYKLSNVIDDTYSDIKPLLSIYKGKNVLNDKNILIVGQMLEKAPFAFDYTSYLTINGGTTNYNYCGYPNSAYNSSYNSGFLWLSWASGYICSGSNIIYECDEENSNWIKTNETLYLDSEGYIGDSLQLLSGVATGNFGKYEIYGITKVKEKVLGINPNTFYQIDGKKYWCRANIYKNIPLNSKINYNRMVAIKSYKSSSSTYYYYAALNNYDNGMRDIGQFFLKAKNNSFGCGAIASPKTEEEYNNLVENNPYFDTYSENKPNADCLNPCIFVRIDDEIVDDWQI
jgi:hypothetical protein